MSDTLTTLFNTHRAHLFAIAYRMVGTVMDAEDIVQEVWLRWQSASPEELTSPKAYLSTIVTRLSIDHLRSAQVQRESYIGQWLPEPLLEATMPDVADHVALAESVSMAFLVLLESLSPLERAVFLLREVFEYDYSHIAAIVEKSEANCRQLVHRARQYLAARRPRFEPSVTQKEQLLHHFIEACTAGDVAALEGMLAADVVVYGDGGGKLPSSPRPVEGRERARRLLLGGLKQFPAGATVSLVRANGQPAIAVMAEGVPFSLTLPDIRDGQICAIYTIFNPDKLSQLSGYKLF